MQLVESSPGLGPSFSFTFASAKTLDLVHSIREVINRVRWKTCCLSSNGNYVVGGALIDNEHKIYIYNREQGPSQPPF